MTKKILDTNAILRFLLQDIPELFETVRDNLRQGGCIVYPEVIAEAVYVLTSVYQSDRKDTADALLSFLDNVLCEKREVVKRGLQLFAETKLDFIDCLLIAYHEYSGYEVLTFDKKMKKQMT